MHKITLYHHEYPVFHIENRTRKHVYISKEFQISISFFLKKKLQLTVLYVLIQIIISYHNYCHINSFLVTQHKRITRKNYVNIPCNRSETMHLTEWLKKDWYKTIAED